LNLPTKIATKTWTSDWQHNGRAQASETKRVEARERYAEVQPRVSKLKRLIFLQ
jgi:hypothetical protein